MCVMAEYVDRIREFLQEHLESRKLVAVHRHADEQSAFIVGRVLEVNAESFVLEMVSSDAEWDGLHESPFADVVRAHVGTAYLEGLLDLLEAVPSPFINWRPEPNYRPGNARLYADLLRAAKQDRAIVTLYASDAERTEVSGFVLDVGDDYVEIEEVDSETGMSDGHYLVPLEMLGSVQCMARSEQMILFRHRRRYGR